MGTHQQAGQRAAGPSSGLEQLESRLLLSAPPLPATPMDIQGSVSVSDSRLRAYITSFEKDVPYPYLDTNGNLTVGVGSNLEPSAGGNAKIAIILGVANNAKHQRSIEAAYTKWKGEAAPFRARHHAPSVLTAGEDQTLLTYDLGNALSTAIRVTDRYNGVDATVFSDGTLNHRQQAALVDMYFNGAIKGSRDRGFLHDLAQKQWHAAGEIMPTIRPATRMASDRHLLVDVLDHFAITPKASTIKGGQNEVLVAVPEDASNNAIKLDTPQEDLTWGSSSLAATVNDKGDVHGVLSGTARISITDTLWKVTSNASVTVQASQTGMVVDNVLEESGASESVESGGQTPIDDASYGTSTATIQRSQGTASASSFTQTTATQLSVGNSYTQLSISDSSQANASGPGANDLATGGAFGQYQVTFHLNSAATIAITYSGGTQRQGNQVTALDTLTLDGSRVGDSSATSNQMFSTTLAPGSHTLEVDAEANAQSDRGDSSAQIEVSFAAQVVFT